MLVDVGFDNPYLNFEDPRPDSLQLLGGNSNGQCTVEGMTWDCMSANRLREMGAAEETLPITVFAIRYNGKTRAIWSGLAPVNSIWTAESSFSINPMSGSGSHRQPLTPDLPNWLNILDSETGSQNSSSVWVPIGGLPRMQMWLEEALKYRDCRRALQKIVFLRSTGEICEY